MRQALSLAQCPHVLIQDADLELDPVNYRALVQPVEAQSTDVVYGNRFANGFPPQIRIPSRIANWIVTFLSNVLFGMSIHDQACGYKLLSTGVGQGFKIEFGWIRNLFRDDRQIRHSQNKDPVGSGALHAAGHGAG